MSPHINTNIDFYDLGIKGEDWHKLNASLGKVVSSGQFVNGPNIIELEKELAKLIGDTECVSCSSGTDGLLLSLLALGIGPGDAVFVPAFTFVASAQVIQRLGARPIFVDCSEESFNIDLSTLESALAKFGESGNISAIKALVSVDLFGVPAPYKTIRAFADSLNIPIVQDAAQAFGSSIAEQLCPDFGDFGVTSFFPTKPLGAVTHGGAIFTRKEEDITLLKQIRQQGYDPISGYYVRTGLNANMSEVTAVSLLQKIPEYKAVLARRSEIAKRYSSELIGVKIPDLPEGSSSTWAQYTILSSDRNGLKNYLSEQGVQSMIYYKTPLHLEPTFANLGYRIGDLPNAEYCAEHVLSLPIYPTLTPLQQSYIIEKVNSFTSSCEATQQFQEGR